MHRLMVLPFLAMVFSSTVLLAMDELRWGGPGYDRVLKNSDRFIARHDRYSQATATLEIWVDSRETVEEVGRMRLISSDKRELTSTRCRKAMRHISAPWACSFQLEAIIQLSGKGKIIVRNRSGVALLEEAVDLDRLSAFASQIRQTP